MKADVTLYIHGYNTCAVECAHGERTVHTSKRVEYWSSWEGKCRLVQLLHNHRTRGTGESLLQQLGWQVADGVSMHLSRIDRDKAKHHQLKTAPAYNGRQKGAAVREEGEGSDRRRARGAGCGTEAEDCSEGATRVLREEAATVRGGEGEGRRGSSSDVKQTEAVAGSQHPKCGEEKEGTTEEDGAVS